MIWRTLLSSLVVIFWIRGLVTNLGGLPAARELYVQHHPDLSKVEAERRITRGTVHAVLLNSGMFLLLLWALWSW